MTKFRRILTAGVAWSALGLVLSPELRGVSYALGAIVLIVVAIIDQRRVAPHIRRVTALIVAAGTLSLLGVLVRAAHGSLIGREFPFPSPADAITLLTYPVLVLAIIRVIKLRLGRLDADLVMDSMIAGAAAAVAQWSLLLSPLLNRPETTSLSAMVQVTYAVASLAVLMSATGLLVAGGHRSPSNRLLASALILTFVMDNFGTALSSIGEDERSVLYLAPVIYTLAIAGLMHPSVSLITSRPSDQRFLRGISAKRVGVMTMAMVGPPTIVLVFLAIGSPKRAVTPAIGTMVLAVLILVRLGRLVRDRERFAAQEYALRSLSEQFVVASDIEHISDAIRNGTEALLGRNAATIEVEVPATSLTDIVTASGTTLEQLLSNYTSATTPIVELAGNGHRFAGLIVHDRRCKALLLIETHDSLDVATTNSLETLCHEASIAIRAVEQIERSVEERSQARFESLISNSSDIVAVLDAQYKLIYVSSVAEKLLGFPVADMSIRDMTKAHQTGSNAGDITGTVLDLVHPEDRGTAQRWLESVTSQPSSPIELRIQHFAGGYSWFEFVGTDRSDDPSIMGMVLNAREVSDRKHAEDQLHLSEARFKALVQNTSDLVVVFNENLIITYASPSVASTFNIPEHSIVGQSFDDVFTGHDLGQAIFSDPQSVAMDDLVEFHFTDAQGTRRIAETTITDLREDPAITGLVINARDVTERREMQARLLYQANYDELTGLANRMNVLNQLDAILSKNAGRTSVGLVLFDIDDLREVNDSLGHELGDQILIEISQRLLDCLAPGDVAARIAGDEFVVALERSHGEDQIMDAAYDMRDRMSDPFIINGREISISVSAGIAFDHDRQSQSNIMLRNADTAMHRSKQAGNHSIAVFEPQMHTATFDRLELRADLARAVAHSQFEAFYQPIVDLGSSRIVGAEALVRWRHPERGLVGPNLFIPLAEEAGLITAIGEWMMRRATRDLSTWRTQFGSSLDDFTISVNLSAHQLRNIDLVNTVDRILTEASVPASQLVLEVTESTLITESDAAAKVMQGLRERGIRLSIDDFGTGYSSLGYIQQFAFDVLKIDKSFIDHIDAETNQRIVHTIISLAKNLGVKTVAEGIEELSQRDLVRELDCDFGQGYLFSRPVPEQDFRGLLIDQIRPHVGQGADNGF